MDGHGVRAGLEPRELRGLGPREEEDRALPPGRRPRPAWEVHPDQVRREPASEDVRPHEGAAGVPKPDARAGARGRVPADALARPGGAGRGRARPGDVLPRRLRLAERLQHDAGRSHRGRHQPWRRNREGGPRNPGRRRLQRRPGGSRGREQGPEGLEGGEEGRGEGQGRRAGEGAWSTPCQGRGDRRQVCAPNRPVDGREVRRGHRGQGPSASARLPGARRGCRRQERPRHPQACRRAYSAAGID
mmetsp:Transcript_5380/g.15861  ORF Transcript_5380/g.15861 Transcript_5380/m.15861 type:complete len:246 (-) Transcript_5380:1273-2010(-)